MSTPPLVSLVMPAYNYAHFAEEAVRSAWAQTWRPLELIAVDDGSTDRTFELLTKLKAESPIPMTVILGEHKGVSGAVDLALRAAKGEFVAILHADDYFRPDKIEKQMALIVDEPDVTLVHTEYLGIDQHGRPTGYDSGGDLPPARGDALRSLLLLEADVRSITILYRRSALSDTGYDASLPVEDWQSILRLAQKGKIAHCPEPLAYRRAHTTNISFTYRKKSKFSFREIGRDIIDEVAPSDMNMEHVYAIHSAVAIKNAVANGAWTKAADGLRQCLAEFPNERLYLLRHAVLGLRSRLWMRYLKNTIPRELLRAVMSRRAARRATKFQKDK